MWTISSSRASVLLGSLATVSALCWPSFGCAQVAPDAPRQAPIEIPQRAQLVPQASASTLELKAVAVRKLDERDRKMVSVQFLKDAREPLAIEVRTQRALPKEPRTSSPVIVLNGERLLDTWVMLPDTLVAFLPNRSKLKDENLVAAEWIGIEEATRSRQPLRFTREQVHD